MDRKAEMELSLKDEDYIEISSILKEFRRKAYSAINIAMNQAYWEIGRKIHTLIPSGAKYGDYIFAELSKRLTADFGKGYSIRSLRYMHAVYLAFPIVHEARAQLTWTHLRLLASIENKEERDFYVCEAIHQKWSSVTLDRQIHSLYYQRLLASQNKEKVIEECRKNQETITPSDIIKDPYILEFIGTQISSDYYESDLEQALINNLEKFMMELGKGYAYIGRQQRISDNTDHWYIDLVFYNYILKCFVLIDLKIGKLTHKDIGQMDFYVRYFNGEIKRADDNPTIGIILCTDKSQIMVKYSALSDNNNLFASQYKLYLPSEQELIERVQEQQQLFEINKKN